MSDLIIDVPDKNVGDTISRQAAIDAAIDAVDEWDGGHNLKRADMIADAINNTVPSAQPEQRWIPTADRPPEFVKSYTDCESLRMEDGKIHAVNPFTVRTSDPVLAYGFCPETRERGVFQVQYEKWEFEDGRAETSWCDIFTGDIEVVNVTAWMPLPEPWKGEEG